MTELLASTYSIQRSASSAPSSDHPSGPVGRKFRAYDKATGEVVWEIELDAGTTGGPMSYMYGGRQYIVVAIGSRDRPAEYVALGLP